MPNLAEKPILWIIEDDPDTALSCSLALQSADLPPPSIIHSTQKATEQIQLSIKSNAPPSLIFLDLNLHGHSAQPLIPLILDSFPSTKIIVITANISSETALLCKNAGAFDFLTKPLDPNRLIASALQALSLTEKKPTPDPNLNPAFSIFITTDPELLALLNYAQIVAKSPHPVLITGENGTGKELLARSIHLAAKPNLPWVPVNVAGLDDTTFSDTLFGHIKGAYTGALQPRQGLIECAANGTLLLDEIGDLKLESQLKLLRLLQENEYFPLGSDKPKKSSARIIATTNRDLPSAIANGSFRPDLFYRLNYHHLHIPPLRSRKNDIPTLCSHFLHLASRKLNSPPAQLSPHNLKILLNYHFPGNVRELEAIIFDAQLRFPGQPIPPDYLLSRTSAPPDISSKSAHTTPNHNSPSPAHSTNPFSNLPILPTLSEARTLLITEALHRTSGNISAAARLLGISPQALWKKLKNSAES
ncbi:MAG: sigma-54 dependent transcriptional regulator [Chthoniobacterales bacterium]|nr:sigma-54 dependent transcriptional regulator [Chthoniobacterales bacterium]